MALNADGLNWKYGIDEGTPARVTEYRTHGNRRYVEIVVDAAYLPTAGTIDFDEYRLPTGGKIVAWGLETPTVDYTTGTSIAISAVNDDGTNAVAISGAITTATLNGPSLLTNLDAAATLLPIYKRIRLTTVGSKFGAGKSTLKVYFEVPKVEGDSLVWDKTP